METDKQTHNKCFSGMLQKKKLYRDTLKCHFDQISDIHFLHVRTQKVFLKYIAKFQSITNTYWLRIWVTRHFLKNTTKVEILLKFSTNIWNKEN